MATAHLLPPWGKVGMERSTAYPSVFLVSIPTLTFPIERISAK